MDLILILLYGSIFLFTVAIVELVFLVGMESRFAEKRTIKKRLLYVSAGGKHGHDKLLKYQDRVLRDVGTFERLIFKLPRISGLDRLIIKTKLPINVTIFLLTSCTLGCLGLMAGLYILPAAFLAAGLGVACMMIPYLLLRISAASYMSKFQEQLPEGLDLLSRAMKSGHALSSGLEMIAQEMDDPIRSEFSATVDEIKLGLTLHEAFENLCERMPSTDLRFFAIAVIVQKETGGNLTEILDNISRLIRERVQFARQVKTLTAEGRLSAVVLIALPILMFFYIYFANYEYLSILWTDPVGKIMMYGAAISTVFGSIVINRMVKIEI